MAAASALADEVRALARLVPPSKPPSQRISRLLHPLLDTLHPKWLRNFLFTAAPVHVRHFLSPTFEAAPLTCELRITTVDPHVAAPAAAALLGDAYHFSGNIFYAPIFTSDHTTLGVGVIDAVATANVPWLLNTTSTTQQRINFRFVRDGRTRTILQVYDAPNSDICVVFTGRIESTTRTSIFSGYFHRHHLRDAVLREDDLLLKDHILPPLISFQYGVHLRACIKCGLPPTAACACQLANLSPQHPFDFDYFQHGMFEHAMTSEGVTSKVVYNSGRQSKRTVLGSRWSLRGVINPALFQGLKTWSIQDHIGKTSTDPLQSLMLMATAAPAPVDHHPQQAQQNQPKAQGAKSQEASIAADGVHDAIDLTSVCPSSSAVSCQFATPAVSNVFTPPAAGLVLVPEPPGSTAAPQSGINEMLQSSTQSTDQVEQGEWWDADFVGSSTVPEPLQDLDILQTMPAEISTSPVTAPERIDVSSQLQAPESVLAPSSVFSSCLSSGFEDVAAQPVVAKKRRGSSVSNREAEAANNLQTEPSSDPQACSSALAQSSVFSSGPSSEPSDIAAREALAKELRAELRREKNRAAARRSNKRNKAMREIIKGELKSERARIPMLRKKEMMLRKENLTLRRVLAELS